MAEEFIHKNRLQEYTQRSAIALPVYHTINEGSPHAPQFRSTVTVDGSIFSSPCTFSNKKAAEQYVAKYALEGIRSNIKNKGVSLIHNDTIFCKSVLHEYADKMNMKLPTYETSQEPGVIPVFISSVLFDNKTFKGDVARSKKEAEQIGARAVIEFILGNSDTGTLMTQIIKSKGKLYAAVHKGNGSCSSQVRNAATTGPKIPDTSVKGKEKQAILSCDVSHDVAYSSGLLANAAAAQSTPPEAEGEHTCRQSSDLMGSGNSLSNLSKAVTAGGSTSYDSRTDLGKPYIVHPVQVKVEVPLAFSSGQHANSAAAQSIPPEAKGEHTCNQISDLIRSGNNLRAPTEAVTAGRSTTNVSRTDPGEPGVVHPVQVKVEVPLKDSGNPPSHSQDVVPDSSKKRLGKRKRKRQKRNS